MNAFPPKSGVSDTLEPQAFITGVKNYFNLHCNMPFGYYAQVYYKIVNYMTERTVDDICLENNNLQVGYKMYSLNTEKSGNVVNSHHAL